MGSARCAIIIPTHNRLDDLMTTLAVQVPAADGLADVWVVDNAGTDGSAQAVRDRFPSVNLVTLPENRLAAARNEAAVRTDAEFLVMLDDDSTIDRDSLGRIPDAFDARPRLAAIGCLTCRYAQDSDEESYYEPGGLPGVFIGCGAAIRRQAWLDAGGYPADFGFYVEEYDLCCRLWRAGGQVAWFDDIRVTHRRTAVGRDFNRMLYYLTRNNLVLWDRYAPPDRRDPMLAQTLERYCRIARKENALAGFQQGMAEGLAATAANQNRQPLTETQFRALFGMDVLGDRLAQAFDRGPIKQLAVYARGKGAEQIVETLAQLPVETLAVVDVIEAGMLWHGLPVLVLDEVLALAPDALVVGSLAPGESLNLARDLAHLAPGVPVISGVRFESLGPNAPVNT